MSSEPSLIIGGIAAGISAFIPTVAAMPGTEAKFAAGAMGAVVAGLLFYLRSQVIPTATAEAVVSDALQRMPPNTTAQAEAIAKDMMK
jgi:uncharacterized membrane protein YeaQ/YmgE (transglycosylase-associated protein family)